MKQYCEGAMNAGAKGVKIICGGRLAGAEMARKETQKLGSIPLHTLDANVDYGVATAITTYGAIGIKVWIYKGAFGEEIERSPRRRRPSRAVSSGPSREDRSGADAVQDSKGTFQADAAASPPKPDSSEPKKPDGS